MSRCSECGRKDCCGSWMDEDAHKLEQENERLRALIVRLEPAVLPYDRCTSHGMVKTNYKNMREGILDALLKLKEKGNEN